MVLQLLQEIWSVISIVRVIKFCIRSSCQAACTNSSHPEGKFRVREKPKESGNEQLCQRAQTLSLASEEQEGLEVTMEMRERQGARRTQMSVHTH